MKTDEVVIALGALAHEYRLRVYRMLVEAGPGGMNAGRIAERLQLPPSSLTFHLQQLQRAGLITQERNSRQLIYSADYSVMNGLVGFLTENCCARDGVSCGPGENCRPTRKTAGARQKGVKT